MQYWWLVGVGGAAGSISRYMFTVFFLSSQKGFPWHTLTVNLLGSLLIGVGAGLFGGIEAERWRLLLLTGFLGGFTTFSTFSIENMRMFQNGHWQLSLAYSLISVVAGLILAYLGYAICSK
jgi:fluoride exporter